MGVAPLVAEIIWTIAMSKMPNRVAIASLLSVLCLTGGAAAQVTSAADYNHPYGMSASSQNAPVDPSLRDGNGNLTVVNGQFTSSAMSQQSGVQQMSTIGGGMGTIGTVTN